MNQFTYLTLTLCMTVLMGCNIGAPEQDFDAYTVESAIDGLESALAENENTSNASTAYGANRLNRYKFRPIHIARVCAIRNMDPAFGSSSCAGTAEEKAVTSQFEDCELFGFSVSGDISFEFDAPETCDSWINLGAPPTEGSVLKTVNSLEMQFPRGGVVNVDTNAHQNYLDEEIGGGVNVTFLEDGRSVTILGIHRQAERKYRRAKRDHSVSTEEDLLISGSRREGTRVIHSGTVKVDHNLAEFTSKTSFDEVNWDASCCYPVSGIIDIVLEGSATGNVSVDFNSGTCGDVEVTKNDVTKALTLEACE